MKWFNSNRMRLLLVGVVAAIIIGGGSVRADFVFGEPTNLGPNVNSGSSERGLSIASDGLSLFFDSDQPDHGDYDLYVATRQTTKDEWGASVNLGPIVNSPMTRNEAHPSISSDGLELYFSGQHWQPNATGYGQSDLWVTRRESLSDPWGVPENLGVLVNTASNEAEPSISADGLSLYFMSERSGGQGELDIWVTTRPTTNADWEVPENLGAPVNSSGWECAPTISADGFILFFQSDRPEGEGQLDIWMTRRTGTSDSWGEPVNLGPKVNTSQRDAVACISPDGHTLYFSSWGWTPRIGYFDIWQSPIIPIVDLNSDGIVDAGDMCIMVDNWHTDNTLCDIAPLPLGDGIVDVQDLIGLSEHLFEEILSPGLISYWKLDEIDGDTAYDSAGDNNGTLSGNPTWQPDNGQIAGALQFDGINDYVSTPFVLNPGFTEFSVFAWLQGGSPGQAIISQKSSGFGGGGATWLGTDSSDGRLITELTSSTAGSLESDSVITDGQWHHIGFVWDGSYRILYVDGIEVAKDTDAQNPLKSATGGLYIGTDKTRGAGTFFSGLIDDVRIYNVALTAEEIAALAQ